MSHFNEMVVSILSKVKCILILYRLVLYIIHFIPNIIPLIFTKYVAENAQLIDWILDMFIDRENKYGVGDEITITKPYN